MENSEHIHIYLDCVEVFQSAPNFICLPSRAKLLRTISVTWHQHMSVLTSQVPLHSMYSIQICDVKYVDIVIIQIITLQRTVCLIAVHHSVYRYLAHADDHKYSNAYHNFGASPF